MPLGFLYAVVATVCETIGKTIDKLNFGRNHIAARQQMFLVFTGMFLSLLGYIVVSRQHFPHFALISFGLMLLITLVSFAGNTLDYVSLKVNDLSLREPMFNFEPILAGLAGYIFFPKERKATALVAFILAMFIVNYGTHRRKLRKSERTGMFYFLLATILYALQPSIYKVTLEYISPPWIAFLRVAAILVLVTIFFGIGKRNYTPKKVSYGLTSGVIYAVEAIASLYAIDKLGVVRTALLTLLGPALMYLSSYFILKEKVRKGELISSILLVVVVLVGAFA
ncbi:MAG TPA: GRP family sugar transporter [Candidatus Saccharimonadales bacterium]|jgi:drug/metabolite transporter (DMT)-like permease|nr:GRP family sugar transporter [Candidatus Saccharimonadales bacterium]